MYSCVRKSLVNPWIDSWVSPLHIIYPSSLLLLCDYSLHLRQDEEDPLVLVRDEAFSQ